MSPDHLWVAMTAPAGRTPRYIVHDLGSASVTVGTRTMQRTKPPSSSTRQVLVNVGAPTDAQWDAAFGLTPAQIAAAVAASAAQAALNAAVAKGADCSSALAAAPGTLVLPITDAARQRMTQLLTIWQESDLQAPASSTALAASPCTVQDLTGTSRTLTVAQARKIFLMALQTYFRLSSS